MPSRCASSLRVGGQEGAQGRSLASGSSQGMQSPHARAVPGSRPRKCPASLGRTVGGGPARDTRTFSNVLLEGGLVPPKLRSWSGGRSHRERAPSVPFLRPVVERGPATQDLSKDAFGFLARVGRGPDGSALVISHKQVRGLQERGRPVAHASARGEAEEIPSPSPSARERVGVREARGRAKMPRSP